MDAYSSKKVFNWVTALMITIHFAGLFVKIEDCKDAV